MAQYIVTDTELEAVADAIRSKSGTNVQLEWPSDFVSAIGTITTGEVGGSVNILSGTNTPIASVGNDGDIYFQTEQAYDDSGEGWIARNGSICKSTKDLGTVNGRHYYKTTDEPALVAFAKNRGYWQPVTASTIATACGYRASSGGPWTYDYTYVIDGVTWYFFAGNHGYNGNPTVSTEYPILQSVDFSTQNGAEEFLSIMGVRFDSGDDDIQVIADSYCKVNGEWKSLIGRYIDEVNMGSGGQYK